MTLLYPTHKGGGVRGYIKVGDRVRVSGYTIIGTVQKIKSNGSILVRTPSGGLRSMRNFSKVSGPVARA